MDAQMLKIVRVAIVVLGDRVLTILSLLMTFGLTCWVMAEPSYERMAMAGFFALVVFLPTAIRERKKSEDSD
ncbi:MAG: hypothetical protein EBT03_13135 [Betaproteobacteria bacterium]|nr:hypothetical protein [Betaproteobacteria bacterium]